MLLIKPTLRLSCLLVFLISCSESDEPKSSIKEITSFSFLSSINSFDEDVVGNITSEEINIKVPSGAVLTNLVASFVTNAERIEVDGVLQISGESSNDFSNPIIYNAFAEDGSIHSYTINVERILSSDKEVTLFGFRASDNEGLEEDLFGEINELEITLEVPYGKDLTSLVTYYETSAVDIYVNSNEQTSGQTINNFEALVSYEARAEDGTTLVYEVDVTVGERTQVTAFNNGILNSTVMNPIQVKRMAGELT